MKRADLLAAHHAARSELKMQYRGLDVYANSVVCSRMVPARVPKTDNQRIRKKWMKRYGTTKQYTTFAMKHPQTGKDCLMMHPDVIARLKLDANVHFGPMYSQSVKRASGLILDDIP